MKHPVSEQAATRRMDASGEHAQHETLAAEVPIALLYNGLSYAVMMATPADLEDFAIGFSVAEGIVASIEHVNLVDVTTTAEGIALQMHIGQADFDALAERSRNLTGRTGCGLCGAATLAAAIRPVNRVAVAVPPELEEIRAAFARLSSAQSLNDATGALHAAAIIAVDGSQRTREDIGRHNAIDKAVGATLRASARPRVLLVTSRASYEVVHKAAQAGCGLVAAISAPTALAVTLAREAGITLVGFARDERLTVYTPAAPPA